ncbi:MAG: phosphatidylglycerophosphatase A family protein [Pyrinomonadaceae bacterium]
MQVKESSDELNPPEVTVDPVVAQPRPARSLKDYLALAIATCGVGYLPLAPGTWGSLVGVGLFYFLRYAVAEVHLLALDNQWITKDAFGEGLERLNFFLTAVLLLVIGVITVVGTWAASRTEKIIGRKDPGIVVIDEVAGQLVAFVFVPAFYFGILVPPIIIVGFVAFRFFDIVKPYPARRLESLPAGLGIMADDIVAGMYAAVVVSVLQALDKLWFILK